MERISEKTLVIPFLLLIKDNPKITTSKIIKSLEFSFSPEGLDAERISGRNDTYFSQKVRNIKSHGTIEKYVIEKKISKDTCWAINDKGLIYLEKYKEIIEGVKSILSNTTFSYLDKCCEISRIFQLIENEENNTQINVKKTKQNKDSFVYYNEDVTELFAEGALIENQGFYRRRSAELRKIAFDYFSKNAGGKIKCDICGFDFYKTYGEHGKGYIEIHHKKPICEYNNQGVVQTFKNSIDNLAPVCANCHRMLHRNKINYDELKEIYDLNNK